MAKDDVEVDIQYVLGLGWYGSGHLTFKVVIVSECFFLHSVATLDVL